MKRNIAVFLAVLSMLAFAACSRGEHDSVDREIDVSGRDWEVYTASIVNQNLAGIGNVYKYSLPSAKAPNFSKTFREQLDHAKADLARGNLKNAMLVFGAPDSAKGADLIIEALVDAQVSRMKGVRILFIGKSSDSERVRAAVARSAAAYQFVEVQ